VKIHKLQDGSAFVVVDLEGAPRSAGIVRAAPKILQAGAVALARTTTYAFASLEQQAGGASAGVNAPAEGRAEAVAAFAEEAAGLAETGVVLDPGPGLDPDATAPLVTADTRGDLHRRVIDGLPLDTHLAGLGAAVAAAAACGGLEGRTVAVEATGPVTGPLVRALTERGATVVALGGPTGTAVVPDGIDPEVAARGPAAVAELTDAPEPAAALSSVDADVLCCGSKQGLIDHEAAERVGARVVVPTGCQPVTAKALAVLRRRDVVVLPDFLSTSGPLLAWWPAEGADEASVRAAVTTTVSDLVAEVLDHDDGPLLAACYRAEAFLRSWRDELPFGRPLA
jgi:hypothetical protein